MYHLSFTAPLSLSHLDYPSTLYYPIYMSQGLFIGLSLAKARFLNSENERTTW